MTKDRSHQPAAEPAVPARGPRGHVDAGRRNLLKRLGLAATAAYAAPLLVPLSGAHASSWSGASFSGSGARRAPPRPQIVVLAPTAAEIDRIAGEGYTLLARAPIGLVEAELGRFQLPAGLSVEAARARVGELVPGAVFDLDHLYRPSELACAAEGCAAFEMIGWRTGAHACPADTVIGMVDTGVNLDHEALAGVDIEAFDVLAEGRQPASRVHGTAIAVLLAGRAGSRTPGLLDGARVIAAQAFHRDTRGADAADAFDVARAVDALAGREVGVINLSFVGPDNAVLEAVVRAARERGIVLVAAAGNAGPNAEPLYPAAYDEVVAVTAVDGDERVYRQANAGEHIAFAAPGVRLWTAASISGGRFRSGTSYAAPFVSAAFAVARARAPEKGVEALIEELAGRAVDLGPPGRDATFGFGLVQSARGCA